MDDSILLDFDNLRSVMPAMSGSLAENCYEAAVFCFHFHGYESGLQCDINDFEVTIATGTIVWTKQFSETIERTFGEPAYAVEFAAEGMAIMTIAAITPYTALKRAVRHDGVDFWLTSKDNAEGYPLQVDARMECKGIMEARFLADILGPLRLGIQQSRQSDDSGLPVYVMAVEFSRPEIYMVQR